MAALTVDAILNAIAVLFCYRKATVLVLNYPEQQLSFRHLQPRLLVDGRQLVEKAPP